MILRSQRTELAVNTQENCVFIRKLYIRVFFILRYMELYKGIRISPGVKDLADSYNCYWILDIILFKQAGLKEMHFQIWNLLKFENDSALLMCENSNKQMAAFEGIPKIDLMFPNITIWLMHNLIVLPGEALKIVIPKGF
ncbi:MAG: hypothetical protein JWN76_577 [Chitinophagaceae bacterium]|nr:hypothetical protein [Chitinophagaceae bacterium]